LAALSSLARAQNYRLEFHSDEALSSCELSVNTPGLLKVYMLFTGGAGYFGGISFKAPKPACMDNATFLADAWNDLDGAIGNTQGTGPWQGVDVVIHCGPLPRYLGFILYSVTGPASPCCTYAPASGSAGGRTPYGQFMEAILYENCTGPGIQHQTSVPASAKGLVMNPNETCRCDIPLAVLPTTWGSVKALYR